MDKISEILSLNSFDAASGNEYKQRKFYGAVKKLPDKETKNNEGTDIEPSEWQEEDRRMGEERRLLKAERNKRFEYRKKRDRRKSKSVSITA